MWHKNISFWVVKNMLGQCIFFSCQWVKMLFPDPAISLVCYYFFNLQFISCCDVCREEAPQELHSGDNCQAESSIWTVPLSPVFAICPAGGAVCQTLFLPSWPAGGTAAHQVHCTVTNRWLMRQVCVQQCGSLVLCHSGWDTTRTPWVRCSTPRDCNRNWVGPVIMTSRLRRHPEPRPTGFLHWWGCWAVSRKWISWKMPGITVTTPSVFLSLQSLLPVQRTSPVVHWSSIWSGHTPSCCPCYRQWFGYRGKREKTSVSGKSSCDTWRRRGRD